EVGHPVRDIHVNSVDASARDLAHAFHVGLTPIWRIRADPYILIAFSYPERAPPPEDCRLAGYFSLQPVGMFFGECVRGLVGVGGDALSSGDVDEGVIACCVRFLSHFADRLQFLFRAHKALIASLNVVVDLNAEYAIFLGAANDALGVVAL